MACEGASEEQIGETLLISVVNDQLKDVTDEDVSTLCPKPKPITSAQDKVLLQQLAATIRVIGDRLDQDERFNDMIDGLGRLADKRSFWQLVEKVFSDGDINWGRIIVLFYSVGKLSAKMVHAHLTKVFADILSLSLDYFKEKLLKWICSKGGWINSISAVTQFSIERFSASSLGSICPPAGLVFAFVAGALLGGITVWQFNRLK